MKKQRYFMNFLCLAALIFTGLFLISGCNIPSPEQLPGEPTPDMNLIMTQVAQKYAATEAAQTAGSELTAEPVSGPGPETGQEPVQPAEGITSSEPAPAEEPSPAPVKKEVLTICLGKEPSTLFFYDESSQAMWSVLESIYDGPFDIGDGEAIPVIFDEITVDQEAVSVQRGDVIADIDGAPVELKPGTVFLPAKPAEGCSGFACLTSWTSLSETEEINRTVITFRLKDSLTWNDGTPLTAEDSVFSMNVNGMKGINASKRFYNLTDSYTAPDEHTVVWRGLPGYQPDDPSEVFWIPLPKHTMQGMSAEMIRASEAVNTAPLGWGAWQIVSWDKGNEIVAERNPHYFGEKPFFDRIVYKFFGNPGDNNINALQSGTCDIIDTSADLGYDLEPILEDVRDGKESVYIRPDLTRQELVLNPDAMTPGTVKPFSDPEMRTVLAQCIDRGSLIRQVLYGQSEVPVDFYPADHIAHDPELTPVPYDPEGASQALQDAGWTVPEDDPEAVRIAESVPGIPFGTKLTFKLVTTDSAAVAKAAGMIRDDLAKCGIAVETGPLSVGELYARGPEGILFGRRFETAMFAWSAAGRPCAVYRSDTIPDAENNWIGTNVGGYRNKDYDDACILPAFSDEDAGKIFAEELPAVPLYFNISIGISANNICGISDRIGSRSILWNMEGFSRSEDSCAVSQWNDIYR